MAIEDNTKRSRKERYKARRNRKNLGVRRSEGTDLDDFVDGKVEIPTASEKSGGERRFLSLAEERRERMESLNTKSRQKHRQSVKSGSGTAVNLDGTSFAFDSKEATESKSPDGTSFAFDSKEATESKSPESRSQKFMNRKSKRASPKKIN